MIRILLLFASIVLVVLVALPVARNTERRALDDAARAQAPGRFVALRHGLVHVLEDGPADGPPVVLVHGFSVPSYVWEPLHERLAAAGFRVIRFDLYGRGWSARPQRVHDRDLFAEQLGDLLDALGLERVDLVGLSMGGAIAGRLVAREPARVRRLALIAPLTLAFDVGPMRWPVVGEWLNRVWLLPKLAASQLSDYVHPERHPGWSERFLPQMQYEGFGHAILSSLRHVMTRDSLGDFAAADRAGVPALLVWGRQDSVVPFEQNEAVRAAMPRIEFLPVDEAGHLPHREQPDLVAARLVEFLRARDASPPDD